MNAALKTSRLRWTDAQTDALVTALRELPDRRAVATKLGLTVKAVQARVHTLRVLRDPRTPALSKGGIKLLPVPTDFAAVAGRLNNPALRAHYDVSKCVIARWRKESGVARPGQRRTPASYVPKLMPENFPAIAPTLTLSEARHFFGVSNSPLERWAANTGIRFRTSVTSIHRATSFKVDRTDNREMSRAGLAADFLRRLGPVFRCDERGNPEGKPTHWRRGSFVLTNEEIIERAERNGWRPDSWKQLAA